jgi:hypothetical protein
VRPLYEAGKYAEAAEKGRELLETRPDQAWRLPVPEARLQLARGQPTVPARPDHDEVVPALLGPRRDGDRRITGADEARDRHVGRDALLRAPNDVPGPALEVELGRIRDASIVAPDNALDPVADFSPIV